MNRQTIPALLIGAFLLTGCNSRHTSQSLEARVARLETRLATAEHALAKETQARQALAERAAAAPAPVEPVPVEKAPVANEPVVPETIEAHQFVLLDSNGQSRATLFTEDDMVSLVMTDEGGNPVVLLSTGAAGPMLELHNPKGHGAFLTVGTHGPFLEMRGDHVQRVYAGVEDDGPIVALDGTAGHSADLGVGTNGPVLRLRNEDALDGVMLAERGLSIYAQGRARATLNLLKGEPTLSILDTNGIRRVMLGESEDAVPFLSLRDGAGKARFQLTLLGRGPALSLYDSRDHLRATLGVSEMESSSGEYKYLPESSLLLSGPDGQPLWSAP